MNIHSLEINDVLASFGTSESGLKSKKAAEILKQVGPNSLPKAKQRSLWSMIYEQLKSTLILVLIVAAVLSAVLEKSYIDAGIILGIVIINTIIGVLQEYKTERTLEHLRNLLTPQARIIRDGKMQVISSVDVVPGDILLIDEGEKIVADARVIISGGLRVNQAILTGESVAQEKNTHTLSESVPLSDRNNMIYQGTTVAAGSGQAVIIATGANTELGHISGMVGQIQDEANPFSQKLEEFSRKIAIFITLLCLFIVAVLLFEGGHFAHSFLVAVSLAVSAIPEGLPAVVALGLAFATKRLVKRNVLVRKLPASETLGRVTVICTDKTGTLTQSEMKVVDIYSDGVLNGKTQNPLIFHTATLCNKAGHGKNAEGVEKVFGDPTEIGLLECGEKNGFIKEDLEKSHTLISEFPFDSERKRMSIVRLQDGGIIRSYVKGAPERILELVKYEIQGNKISTTSPNRIQELQKILAQLSGEGKRVLAMAYKDLPKKDTYTQEEVESDLVFIGFMAMMDPPRVEVAGAIKTCQEAGIRVIMITGDSELTAGAVAQIIGLGNVTLDATKLSTLSDEELGNKLKTVDVFSRIAPQDKLRIVRILKSQGHIVAMTGDGVNDALALKQSDIGIAMGLRGTDVARDASDMVLLDDNFSSIVSAVEEGRRIYDNTKKFIKYLLACNFYEVILLAACVIIYRDPLMVPFVAIQILWINLVTDSFPALALSTQETEADVMKRKPVDESLLAGINGFIIWAGIIGFFVVGTIFFVFVENLMLAQTLAVASSVIYQMMRALSCGRLRAFDIRVNKWLFFAITTSLVAHFGLLASPYAGTFKFVSLWEFQPIHFVWILGLPLIGYILGELSKYKKLGK